MKSCLSILFSFIWLTLYSQTFQRYSEIVVLDENNDTLRAPFAGGLNTPQFSEIDLNLDGIMDLFVYEKDGGIIKTFINGGTPNEIDYTYQAEFALDFPELKNFALLVDYNCDGKKDIFTGAIAGMSVYKNVSTSSTLKFELVTSLLMSDYTPNLLNLFVPNTDIPAIVDVDNDGDIDVLTFGVWGSTVEYHKNLSMDLYGHCDSLTFVAETTCWGNFAENSTDNTVTLGNSCKGIVPHQNQTQAVHSGSTILALDLDGDSDKEVVLGDVSFNNLVMLTNGGDPNSANMVSQVFNFPSNSVPVDIPLFPAAFFVDVNNDQIRDLLVAPNFGNNASENFESVWYYQNTGSDSIPNFTFIQDNFLQDEMIDVGAGANALFYDINQDGLEDILVGNYGYFDTPDLIPSIAYLENIGTPAAPTFKIMTRDYAGSSSWGKFALHPTLGDLDNDGDDDMLIGDLGGEICYLENIAGAGSPCNFTLNDCSYMGIDVGQLSTPQLVDYNGDGLLDLLVGERSGNINYFENVGTLTAPFYNLGDSATTEEFGQIDNFIPCCTGHSTVHLTRDSDNKPILYVGSEEGYIYIYTDIDTVHYNTAFNLSDSIETYGHRVSVFLSDIDQNGEKELLVGEYSGGASILRANNKISLVFPENNSSNIVQNVILNWNSVYSEALAYEYEVDTTNSFNSTELITGLKTYISSASNNEDTELQLSNLVAFQTYFWRVRYITASDTSEWSEVWNFTTNDQVNSIYDKVSSALKIYPNPTSNTITVKHASDLDVPYQLLNLQGEKIASGILGNGMTIIDLSNYAEGLYFLETKIAETSIYSKVLKVN